MMMISLSLWCWGRPDMQNRSTYWFSKSVLWNSTSRKAKVLPLPTKLFGLCRRDCFKPEFKDVITPSLNLYCRKPESSYPAITTAGEKTSSHLRTLMQEVTIQPDNKAKLLDLLLKWPQVCTDQLGKTHMEHHEVPVRKRAYRVSPEKHWVIEQHITEMINKGIIEPSQSSWAAPVVMMKKRVATCAFAYIIQTSTQRHPWCVPYDPYPLNSWIPGWSSGV